MTPWHRFRSGAGRSEATTASYGSSRLARPVRLSSSWSLGRLHAPRRRSAESRVERAPRVPRDDPSMARSAHRRRRSTPPRTHPRVSRQRPMSGCAAIGLALGRTTRARSCSRTQDQEDDRPTRQWSTTSQDERGRRFAPPCAARKRRDGAIPRLLRRLVLTPGLASLAAGATGDKRRRPPHHRLPTARRSGRRACQLDERRGRPACTQRGADLLAKKAAILAHGSTASGEARVVRRARGGPSSWQAGGLPAACKRVGHAARPTGRRVGRSRRASEASPGVSTALKAGMTPPHRFRSGAGRSEATTAS